MNQALAPLLDLKRKTESGEIAPLVALSRPPFWPSRTYSRKEKIFAAQLELRKQKRLPPDPRIANLVALLDLPSLKTFRDLFPHLIADDSWPTVARLLDEDSPDDLGLVHFLRAIDQHCGKLTDEESNRLTTFKTLGDLAALLEKVAPENREKAPPPKRNLLREFVFWLCTTLFGLALLWALSRAISNLLP